MFWKHEPSHGHKGFKNIFRFLCARSCSSWCTFIFSCGNIHVSWYVFSVCFDSPSPSACFQIDTWFLSTLGLYEDHWKCKLWPSWWFLLLTWWLPGLLLFQCVSESPCLRVSADTFPPSPAHVNVDGVVLCILIIKYVTIHSVSAESVKEERRSHPQSYFPDEQKPLWTFRPVPRGPDPACPLFSYGSWARDAIHIFKGPKWNLKEKSCFVTCENKRTFKL